MGASLATQNGAEHMCHRICTNVRPMTGVPKQAAAKVKTVALQDTNLATACFSSIATDERGAVPPLVPPTPNALLSSTPRLGVDEEKVRALPWVPLLDAGSIEVTALRTNLVRDSYTVGSVSSTGEGLAVLAEHEVSFWHATSRRVHSAAASHMQSTCNSTQGGSS